MELTSEVHQQPVTFPLGPPLSLPTDFPWVSCQACQIGFWLLQRATQTWELRRWLQIKRQNNGLSRAGRGEGSYRNSENRSQNTVRARNKKQGYPAQQNGIWAQQPVIHHIKSKKKGLGGPRHKRMVSRCKAMHLDFESIFTHGMHGYIQLCISLKLASKFYQN